MSSSGVEWLKSVLGRSRKATDVCKPVTAAIGVDSWSRPDNALGTLCITQADWSIRWHLEYRYGVTTPEFERRGVQHVSDRAFDVYEAAIPGGRREYWMDVSYWFGRGLLLQSNRLDAPAPGQETSIGKFFGPEQIENLPFQPEFLPQVRSLLDQMPLRVAGYSSQQCYNNVAAIRLEHDRLVVEATAVRRFVADALPLFHGFRFLKPFLMHQAMHRMLGADPGLTEVSPKADYAVPKPGVDCIGFTPASQETPAHDFWCYLLWAHKPGAFADETERKILTHSAATAVRSGFVRPEELVEALESLDVGGIDGEVLRDLAAGWVVDSHVECDTERTGESASVTAEAPAAESTTVPLLRGGDRATTHDLVALRLPQGTWYRDEQSTATEINVVFWALDESGGPEGSYLIVGDVTDNPDEPVVLEASGVPVGELDAQLRQLAESTIPAGGVELVEWRGSSQVLLEQHLQVLSAYVTRREGIESTNYSMRFDVRGRKVVLTGSVPTASDDDRHRAMQRALSAFEIVG